MLEYIERLSIPGDDPELVVIWLHGLGADCNDFASLVPELKLSRCIKFIFPNAPMMPITINNGYVMRAWYDIKSLDKIDGVLDDAGIEKSRMQIDELIDAQIQDGIDAQKIIVAGFSQGGVISYAVGLKSKDTLGGVLALSCYLPYSLQFVANLATKKTLPILACHGVHDTVISSLAGMAAYETLKSAGYGNIQWRQYAMEHSVCMEEVADIAEWLVDR